MSQCFNGLTTVNVELTNKCNKNCWMCGRRKIDREYPEFALNYGEMDFELVKSIAEQLPDGIVVQLHNNGEPLMYPKFKEAAALFKRQIRCVDTNGILLLERAADVIDNLDTLTISTFENDEEGEKQHGIIEQFLKLKGDRKPNVIIRCLGKVDVERYKKYGCIIATRILHSPMGSFKYTKKTTVPEIGVCLDLLNHMAIRTDGSVSICVRLDPQDKGIIGNCKEAPLVDIWNNQKRRGWIEQHLKGDRRSVPLCSTCEFWGVPTGY